MQKKKKKLASFKEYHGISETPWLPVSETKHISIS